MPLPTNSSLSLLACSRPGDTLRSKPKQAMIVRMSSETLDALESFTTQPQVQFQFGDSPGIFIGDSYFSMGHWKENSIHELYLRASSATKKTAPLKLYANVIGKFAVERELADELRDKIRESTQDAANQRNKNTTVFLETPPDNVQTGRKRKEPPSSTLFRKPLRPSDRPKPVPPAPTPAPSNKPSASTQSQRDGPVPLRKRLIHCLAAGDKTDEQLVKLLGGSRSEILDLLDQLAELKPGSTDKSQRLFQLKSASWKEVRPFEWPRLTEQERVQMARTARMALKSLRIPESDPVWNHFHYKSPPPALSSTAASSSTSVATKQELPKRGVSSREVKEKKQKPKPDPKAEIMMKDESQRATNRNDANNRTTDPRAIPPGRRQPPATSKPVKSNIRQTVANVPHVSSPNAKGSSSRPQGGEAASSSKATANQGNEKSRSSRKARQIHRENAAAVYSDSEDEKPPSQAEKVRLKERTIKKEKEDTEAKVATAKRKAADHDDDEYGARPARQKKRKTDPQTGCSTRDDRVKDVPTRKANIESRPGESAAQRELSVVSSAMSKKRKPSPSPPTKRIPASNGKDYSESPGTSKPSPSTASGSKTSKPRMSSKTRRRSPIYTSSEEEKEETPLIKRSPVKSTLPATATSNTAAPPSHAASRSNASRPLPTDHAGLRSRYNTSYLDYVTSFQQLVMQKGKIDQLLNGHDLGSVGSITDSEGDIELLTPEELERVTANYRKLHGELETIQQMFNRSAKVEPSSD